MTLDLQKGQGKAILIFQQILFIFYLLCIFCFQQLLQKQFDYQFYGNTYAQKQVQQNKTTNSYNKFCMLQFKSLSDKKKFGLSTQKKDTSRYDNIDFADTNQYALRLNHDRNEVNGQLVSNHSQLKELLKERKILLERKADTLFRKNKQRMQSIANARHQDLKNQAKMLNDRSVMNLIQHAEELNGANNTLRKIAEVKDMGNFDSNQRNQGKIYWDTHKQIEKQMKRKAEVYTNYSRQLKSINQRQRGVFNEIEKYESEMISQLTRARKDPDHIRRAEKCNEQIDRCKAMLRELKVEKDRMKKMIQDTIDQIIDYNNKSETILKRRHKELTEMFAGSENLAEFDQFMKSLEIVIQNKHRDERQEHQSLNNLRKLVKDYDLLIEQVDKYKEEEEEIFHHITDELRENLKAAILEKAYFTGIPQNINQADLLRKCRGYRKLLADLSEDRPKIDSSMNKISQMNSMLYPVKKAYSTEDSRRQELKRELRKLCANHSELQRNAKRIRDFAFEMDANSRKRQAIEHELNEFAEKGNLTQYKNKVKQLESLNRMIEESRDFASNGEVQNMEQTLITEVERLYEQYEDILQELQLNDQNVNLGSYLNKLEKRISLI